MSRATHRALTLLLIIIAGVVSQYLAEVPELGEAQLELSATPPPGFVRVVKSVDGDTVELAGGTRVRYIGVNTPETVDPRRPVQCFGKEASERNRALVEGRFVRLVRDISETDKYDRLLRYVYLEDGTFVNLLLVREGLAQVSTYPPDVTHARTFQDAQAEARANAVGLWGACR